jgi:hypothetical protein
MVTRREDRGRWHRPGVLSLAVHALALGALVVSPHRPGSHRGLGTPIDVDIAAAAPHTPAPRQAYQGPMLRRRPHTPAPRPRRSSPRAPRLLAVQPPPFQPAPATAAPPERPPAQASRPEPEWISSSAAGYLRTYDRFPEPPDSLPRRRAPYLVVARLCVGTEGQVEAVSIEQGAAPALDALLSNTLRTWRYRPLIVDGQRRPFCHVIRIKYQLL